MIKKVVRPAVYNDYNPELVKKALIKSNEIYKGGLNEKQIEQVYQAVLSTMQN
jgi:hypothetical protein